MQRQKRGVIKSFSAAVAAAAVAAAAAEATTAEGADNIGFAGGVGGS